MPKRKKSKTGKSTSSKSKKETSSLPEIIKFWKPGCEDELLNFSPYNVSEGTLKNIDTFCKDFSQKLEFHYQQTVYGWIDYLIKRFTLFPPTKREETRCLDKLIELASREIENVSAGLMEMHKIKEKELDDVFSTIAERDSFSSFNLFFPLLSETSSLLPVWMGSINETAPRMVGAIPPEDDSEVEPGQYVAAFVCHTIDNPEPDVIDIPLANDEFGIIGSWILARVLKTEKKISENHTPKIVIVDIDKYQDYPHYTVERKVIVPLPLYRADPRTNPEAIFPIGSVVLALYYDLTCFFPAIVLDTPKTLNDTYTLCFRDLQNKLFFGLTLRVQQRYVIKFVEPLSRKDPKNSIFSPAQREAINTELILDGKSSF